MGLFTARPPASGEAAPTSILIVEAGEILEPPSLQCVLSRAVAESRAETDGTTEVFEVSSCGLDQLLEALERQVPDVLIVDMSSLRDVRRAEVSLQLAGHKRRFDVPILAGLGERHAVQFVDLLPCADDYVRLPGGDDSSGRLVLDFLKFKLQALWAERARRREEEALRYRVEIERLVARISAEFIRCPYEEIEGCVERALQLIGDRLDLKRVYVVLAQDGHVSAVNEWQASWDVAPRLKPLVGVRLQDCPVWAVRQMDQPDAAYVCPVAELPDDAAAERASLGAEGTQLQISVPLVRGDRVVGLLGGDSPSAARRWLQEDVRLLNMTGAVLVGVIERRRMLAELRSVVKQQVRHEERLGSMSAMARSVVHDFRNVLTLISCSSDMMLMSPDGLEDKERVRRDLIQIKKAVLDLDNMLRRLRQFYRPRGESEIFVPINLAELAEGVLSLAAYQLENLATVHGLTIDLRADLPQDLPLILGNDTELREVLTNLLLNAGDAIIELHERRGSTPAAPGVITARAYADGDHLVLEVSDNGVGMSAEVLQRCMEPNFTTKGSRGMGLGLALVSGVVQRHHGSIDIASEPALGSRFQIRLPLDCAEAAAEGESHELRVLLVGDDASVGESIGRFLTSKGHHTQIVAQARDALRLFRNHWFDLVVADQWLAGDMNGSRLATVVKEIAPNKPVILLAAEPDPNELAEASSANFVLRKPVDLVLFRQALKDLIQPAAHLF